MKKILVASFDMEVGGVERSLISMLNTFDYNHHQIDMMLYSHTGDFMNLLPKKVNLIPEVAAYRTFRMSIRQIFKTKKVSLGLARILARYKASLTKSPEIGYKQMQYMWQYSLPFLPDLDGNYDVAISYLWPHYFVSEFVQATTKIAWIHTDFSSVEIDINMDLQVWSKFNVIIAVSEECKIGFIQKFPELRTKVKVIENITSPEMVKDLANDQDENPMLNDDRFKIITVARLSYAKGIDRAVQSLRLLKDRGFHFVWYVVGYGGDENTLRRLITECNLQNDFILMGKKVNPYPFIKAADLYVQPSRYEGKAVTVVEAQILGKPVLITNYRTASSQVKDGFDGIICDQSIEGIASGIERLYKDHKLRKQLQENCKTTDFRNDQELEKLYELI